MNNEPPSNRKTSANMNPSLHLLHHSNSSIPCQITRAPAFSGENFPQIPSSSGLFRLSLFSRATCQPHSIEATSTYEHQKLFGVGRVSPSAPSHASELFFAIHYQLGCGLPLCAVRVSAVKRAGPTTHLNPLHKFQLPAASYSFLQDRSDAEDSGLSETRRKIENWSETTGNRLISGYF